MAGDEGGTVRRASSSSSSQSWVTSCDVPETSSSTWLSVDDVEKLVDERLLVELLTAAAAGACRPAALS